MSQMRLLGLMLHHALNTPGLRLPVSGLIKPGEGPLVDWRIHVRGPRVILASPRGWIPGEPKTSWTGDARVMFDIPREHVTLMWQGAESDVDGISKWSPAAESKTPDEWVADEQARAPKKSRPSPPQDSAVEDADPADESNPPAPAAARSTMKGGK